MALNQSCCSRTGHIWAIKIPRLELIGVSNFEKMTQDDNMMGLPCLRKGDVVSLPYRMTY